MILARKPALGLLLAASGVIALGVAYDAQYRLGLMPCEICLIERMPWRVIIVCGVLVALLRGMAGKIALAASFLCLLASLGLSGLHIGVEQKWWQSPFPACHAAPTHGMTAAERFANLPMSAPKPCDTPDYLWHLPISMTALGGVYAAFVLIAACILLWRNRHRT